MYLRVYYAFLCLAKYVELRTVNRQLFENIHELKTAHARHHTFACCFIWVWNLVADIEGGKEAEGV